MKTWCPWCVSAKRWLDEHQYQYEEIDVEEDREAYREMIRLSGQSLTPTLVVDDKVLPDFGPDQLEIFLKKHNILP